MTAFTDSEYTYLQDEVLEVLNSMVVVDSDADSEGMNYVYVAAIPGNIATLARLVPNVDEYVRQYTEDGALYDYETDVIDIQHVAWDCGAKWFDGEKFLLYAPLDLEAIKERIARATPGEWSTELCYDRLIGTYLLLTDKGELILSTYDNPTKQDAKFIAHARQDVPALIAEVERLRVDNFLLRRHITTDESRVENEKLRAENERLHELLCEIHIDCEEMLDVYVEESGVVAIREKILEVWRTR